MAKKHMYKCPVERGPVVAGNSERSGAVSLNPIRPGDTVFCQTTKCKVNYEGGKRTGKQSDFEHNSTAGWNEQACS